MEQPIKRFKPARELCITDIASSIDHISKSMKSMSESYSDMLRVNKAVVTYLQNASKCEERINLDQTMAELERTSI